MDLARRLAVAGLAAALAQCTGRPPAARRPGPPRLDEAALISGYTQLAARARPAVFGLGVALLSPATVWVSDARSRFPMLGEAKLVVAACALAQAGAGALKLNEAITLTDADLSPGGGPIDQAFPSPPAGARLTLRVADLIALAVQRGDNTAADTLMKRIGGPAAVSAWLAGKGLGDIRLDRYERQLQVDQSGMPPFQPAWKDARPWLASRDAIPAAEREAAGERYLADPRDTATLPALLGFLTRLAGGELMSPVHTRLLLRLMSDSQTGGRRLEAGLPPDAHLAHKAASTPTDLGLTLATGDIGLVTLADGPRFAVAACLAGSTATEADRDRLIADAARLVASCVS
ncbi:MAG TPA: serine hydrolase [Caulobacteraceae bacterium]|nr:serine hydrolase [Caulobacteraceae bacterium]